MIVCFRFIDCIVIRERVGNYPYLMIYHSYSSATACLYSLCTFLMSSRPLARELMKNPLQASEHKYGKYHSTQSRKNSPDIAWSNMHWLPCSSSRPSSRDRPPAGRLGKYGEKRAGRGRFSWLSPPKWWLCPWRWGSFLGRTAVFNWVPTCWYYLYLIHIWDQHHDYKFIILL